MCIHLAHADSGQWKKVSVVPTLKRGFGSMLYINDLEISCVSAHMETPVYNGTQRHLVGSHSGEMSL